MVKYLIQQENNQKHSFKYSIIHLKEDLAALKTLLASNNIKHLEKWLRNRMVESKVFFYSRHDHIMVAKDENLIKPDR